MTRVVSSLSRAIAGCYEAERAAALAGVPKSTVYDWARKGVISPSVSPVREMLWSYADLMALRIVHWLRHPKDGTDAKVPPSPMSEVRRALSRLDELGLDLWSETRAGNRTPIVVSGDGRIWLPSDTAYSELVTVDGDRSINGTLDVLGPFDTGDHRGPAPDLIQPRPHLRIVPGKISGEPHIEHSRVATQTIAALAQRGFATAQIRHLYPDQKPEAIEEAVDLERSLDAAA